jgi:hypothetical protein
MQIAHLFAELRFAAPSLAFIAKGMELANVLSKTMPRFQVTFPSVTFSLDEAGGQLVLDPVRALVAIHGPKATPERCIEVLVSTMKQWRTTIKEDPPTYQRVGFRAQMVEASDMTRAELIRIYTEAFFSEHYRGRFGQNDFALTIENLDGAEGFRIFAGAMHRDELIQKWPPAFSLERDGKSYLTLDIDLGTAKAQNMGFESFIRTSWADIGKQAEWFFAPMQ